ncbi:hypothetical protein [Botrimarina mediterranea]|uniref:hypothetical protein n=1 Tax=Botrimarina mediterranea TaxID=2528022 RepID=UPI00118ACB63|nr:hypothetical protein K2D_45280 [Planctomycetes bacterium K2D]
MADSPFTDAELHAYLDEAAAPERIAAIEAALRDDDELRERLATLVSGRDAGLHSLGEVWRRNRLTCPSREQLGSHLLGVLPEAHADYVRFHLEVVDCRWCNANVEDLRERHERDGDEAPRRRGKYFESSVGRLSDCG